MHVLLPIKAHAWLSELTLDLAYLISRLPGARAGMATYQIDCPSCYEFSGKSIADFLRHVRFFHADVNPFSICCNLGCGRERPFTNFLTFRDHVYQWHSGVSQH